MLYEKLLAVRKKKRVVGFCMWKDGEGLLFGRVLAVDAVEARFELVHPDGTLDEVATVRLDDITRVEDSPAYVKRLTLFAKLKIPQSKGQVTTAASTIAARLRTARRTGECVDVTLKDERRRDCRVLAMDDEWVELEEYGDDPLVVVDTRLVRRRQVTELRWRSTTENAVSAVWRARRRAARPRRGTP